MRFLGGELKTSSDATKQRFMDEISAYPGADTFPDALIPGQLYVDPRHEALLCPIDGTHIPFHISTIKNAAKTDEGKISYLRINFFHPGAASYNRDSTYQLPDMKGDENYFIRELTYKSGDSKTFATVFRQLKELIKRVKAKD
jgi:nucleosome binding factor SPN SPT16 subunit